MCAILFGCFCSHFKIQEKRCPLLFMGQNLISVKIAGKGQGTIKVCPLDCSLLAWLHVSMDSEFLLE